MGKYYSMTLIWQVRCRFIFLEWQSNTLTTFVIGCVVTMLLAFLTMALPKIKKSLQKILFHEEKNSSFQGNYHSLEDEGGKNQLRMTPVQLIVRKRVIPTLYALFYALFHVAIMLIMMSMNGYVILAIVAGFTVGFAAFSDPPCSSKSEGGCAKGCS